MERLRLANHELFFGNGLSEGPEATISINIINDDCTLYSYGSPCSIQFEAYVAFTVQAVVDKEINFAEARKQLGKASSA